MLLCRDASECRREERGEYWFRVGGGAWEWPACSDIVDRLTVRWWCSSSSRCRCSSHTIWLNNGLSISLRRPPVSLCVSPAQTGRCPPATRQHLVWCFPDKSSPAGGVAERVWTLYVGLVRGSSVRPSAAATAAAAMRTRPQCGGGKKKRWGRHLAAVALASARVSCAGSRSIGRSVGQLAIL